MVWLDVRSGYSDQAACLPPRGPASATREILHVKSRAVDKDDASAQVIPDPDRTRNIRHRGSRPARLYIWLTVGTHHVVHDQLEVLPDPDNQEVIRTD